MIDIILTWLGIGVGYLVATTLIVGGGYLAFVLGANPLNPLTKTFHFLGIALIAAGILIGAINYGKTIGAADCEAAWRAKNYEAKIDRLRQEADAKKIAANIAEDQAQQLASANDDLQKKVGEYQTAAVGYAACRRATGDDDRRVCAITGRSAAGCSNSK